MTVAGGLVKSVRLAAIRARYSNEDDYCLSQSLATILDYWQLQNDVVKIGSIIGEDRYLGKALQTLDARADEISYVCFSPNVASVKALIDVGIPVLLVGHFLPLGADIYMGHATVMVGYDEVLEHVLIEDSNWFQGWEMLPYHQLHELRAVAIAPPDRLAALTIELPDQDYHKELNRLEPLVVDEDIIAGTDKLTKRTLALPERRNQEEVKLTESTVAEKGTSVSPEALDQIINLQPNHWYGHFLAGMDAISEKDRYTAVRHLTRAVETSSRIALPHLFVADCYAEDKVTLEARDWLRNALKREPDLYVAKKFLVQLLFDPDRKVNDIEKRIQFLSNGRGIKSNLEEAIKESYRYLDSQPGDEEALMNLLVCELKLERFKDAEQTARGLIKQTNHVQMQVWLAISLEKQGKFDEAISAATTGKKLAPDQETKGMFERMIGTFSKSKAGFSNK